MLSRILSGGYDHIDLCLGTKEEREGIQNGSGQNRRTWKGV